MALISTYNIDDMVTAYDKWVGTDYYTGKTKNYTPTNLANFFNLSNAIGIGGQVSFKFYNSFIGGRPQESITAPTSNPSFSSITTLKIHKNSGGGNYCLHLINYFVGGDILISNTTNVDKFGHYSFVSMSQDLIEPDFYNIYLTYKGGNGSLENGITYSISHYAKITAPSIPSLQQVTDAGNTTTNTINIAGFISGYTFSDGYDIGVVTGGWYSFIHPYVGLITYDDDYNSLVAPDSVTVLTNNGLNYSILSADGSLVLKKNGGSVGTFSTNTLTQTRSWNLPNASGTIALTSDIPSVSGYVPNSRTLTINGTSYDLTVDRTWTIPTGTGDMTKSVYDVDNTGVVDNAEAIKIIGRNSTGSTLYKGTVIYLNGATGNRPNFVKAQANTEATSAGTFGIIVDDLANNTDGYCIALGYLDNLDTRTTATNPFTNDTLSAGDTIYLSPTTAGYITNVKPSAPNHLVYIGKVTRTGPTNGTIVYRIQNGYELEELHNVAISSVADKQLLSYDNATSLWKNKSVTTDDIADSTNKRYVTDTDLTTIRNQSGTNTGDETASTIRAKVGNASASNTGVLNSTDWSTFNGKQNALGYTPENVSNKSDSYTSSSSTTYSSTKALVDGLATKQPLLGYTPYRYVNTTQTTVTGTLNEAVVATSTISGNTFNSNDVMKQLFKTTKGVTLSNVTMRVKINTSNTLSGATQIATYTFATTSTIALMQRTFDLSGGNLYGFGFASSQITDVIGISTGGSSTAYNPVNTLYVFFTLQLGNSSDSCTFNMANITN